MPIERIYISRHGFRSNWVTDVPPTPSPTGIEGDPALSEHGLDQAEELGKYYDTVDPKIDRVFSSPFYRCLQSINPTAEKLDLEIIAENGFGEWYGKTRATHPSPASHESLKKYFNRVVVDYEPLFVPSTSGETIQELHDRGVQVLSDLIDLYNEKYPEVRTILICTHAATMIILGRALVGDSSLPVRTGTCSVSMYEADPNNNRPGNWTAILNGYTEHLSAGEERHWSFESGEYDFLDRQAYLDVHEHAETN
ncbi:histidine phosphatase superfamily [Dipodascopsis uninucleata]